MSRQDVPGRVGEVRSYGPGAVLVEVDDAVTAVALAQWARSGGLPVTEAVPGARTVLLDGLDLEGATGDAVRRALETWQAPDAAALRGPVVEVPVSYDGEDLDRVATLWSVTSDEVVARHTGTEFTSAFCGFAPGFAYLTGLPGEWAVPRLESPRPRVPAGAVALADTWCGVYPGASPGGWLLLGTTDVRVWDPERADPCVLGPGTRVRFVAR